MDEVKRVWEAVRPTLHDAGIRLWAYEGSSSEADPQQTLMSNGFAYLTPTRGEAWVSRLQMFNCHNELTCGGSTIGGLNVVIRVAAIGDEGKRHLEILRKLAQGTTGLWTENHVVPLWKEVQFDDIVFMVSPYVGHSMEQCYGRWANNSVGDIVDMILQALEAIVFVHGLGIVHRDLCKSNYLVQWHPESLSTMRVPLCRPRAFLTDFETAHEFPPDMPTEERLLSGLPVEDYQRPVPPEMDSGALYDPFKADVWQFAESFSDVKTTVPSIDAILEDMFALDVSLRLSASDARDRLAEVVHSTPPISLLIPPLLLNPLPIF
ncbi:kinase-like domain-containing protein [Rhodofomes roseus]|uniref:Kinase-like domain-containing protein n=1 Tax=Rhodofomes roseus TaxID=34475 RepID=A0ABQ8K2N4_9APHY|nr:kinase-like domain-containing protein [Rhodofomes roseus]KAH9830782.1 kinase-like domain-containing protein [Rhodofomes roseus]